MTNFIDKTKPSDQKSFKVFSLQLEKKMNLQIKLKKSKCLSYWEILLIIQIQKIIMNIYI
ncbi:hypothetical protein BBUWI9123_E0028 (plasmid) [Borreliella burgdorferi WI91-23]|nr:hypothetical protein BBUWI9123_E0028 [Borreliella burgdorferi WI91-23]